MTPTQKIKHAILLKAAEFNDESIPTDITVDNVDDLYYELEDAEEHYDATSEIRCSGEETGLKCEHSRHYESDAVAAKMPDGSWVGWTYWYGGGKHGEPEDVDWMGDAYDLDVTEEEKVVTVRTFKLVDKKV